MQVIETAIALDPEERYQNPSELLAALSALKVGPYPWVWRIVKPLIAVAAFLVGLSLIGALTTEWFNIELARSGFVNETPLDWVTWGRLASFGPFIMLLMVAVPVAALVVARRVVVAFSSRARALDDRMRDLVRGAIHRLRLDEAAVLGSCALIVSTVTILAAIWYFAPLLVTLLTVPLQTNTDAQLRMLSHDAVYDHNEYRQVFALVVILSVVVWYPVRKLMQKGQTIHRGILAAGVAATCFALALLHFPYRLMYFNDVFEAVTFNGTRCYVIGERADQELLFCPGLQPPRNRIVAKQDPGRVPLGITESMFKAFERPAVPAAPTP